MGRCWDSSRSLSMFNNHLISFVAVDTQMYSASVEDRAMQLYFLESLANILLSNLNKLPVVDFLFTLSFAQSVSLYAVTIRVFDLSRTNFKSLVVIRCIISFSMVSQSGFLSDLFLLPNIFTVDALSVLLIPRCIEAPLLPVFISFYFPPGLKLKYLVFTPHTLLCLSTKPI